MHPEDIPKMAITMPFGTFTFKYSCFELCKASATFQLFMDTILRDLPLCVCYIDDILIFSSSKTEHLQHLHIILDLLQNNGLIIRHDKCVIGAEEVEFLGHQLPAKGVAPLPAKVKDSPTLPDTHEGEIAAGIPRHGNLLPQVPAKNRHHPHTPLQCLKGENKVSLMGP